jgi:hypothetical protein
LLHRKSPDLLHSIDNGGLTPYMIACRSGFVGTINMLAGMGSSTNQKDNASRSGPDHLEQHHPHLSPFATYQRNIDKFPWLFRPWLPNNVCNPVTHNCLKTVLGLGYVHWILYIIPLTLYLLWSHILLAVATPFLWFVSHPSLHSSDHFSVSSHFCVVLICYQVRPAQGGIHFSRFVWRHRKQRQMCGGLQRPCIWHAVVRCCMSHMCYSKGLSINSCVGLACI